LRTYPIQTSLFAQDGPALSQHKSGIQYQEYGSLGENKSG